MSALLEPDALNRDSLREAIGQSTATVETFDELAGLLRDQPDCETVILGPSIDLDLALGFAERTRATNPTMGVLLVRRRTDAAVLAQASRAGVREVVAERDLGGLAEAVQRSVRLTLALRHQGEGMIEGQPTEVGRMVTIFSPKGGAGKTTLAVNMGVLLARQGYRTLVLDLDLAFGDVPISLGLRPEHTFEDIVTMGERLDSAALKRLVTIHESGLHVMAPPTDPGVHEQVTNALMQRLLLVALPEYDYIVADTAPSLDERSITVMETSELVFMVTTLDIPSLKNLKVAIETLRLVNFPVDRLRVVMNRADSKVGLEPKEVAKALGIPVVANIPSSRLIPSSTNRGVPIVTDQPRSLVALAITELVSDQLTRNAPAAPKRAGLFSPEDPMSLSDRLSQARKGREFDIATPDADAAIRGARPRKRSADPHAEIKRSVHAALVESLGPQLYHTQLSEADLNQRVRVVLHEVLTLDQTPMPAAERGALAQQIADEILGYGPLEPFLRDPEVTEVMVNGYDTIYVERFGRIEQVDAGFTNDAHLRRTIDKIVGRVGRRVDESSPMVDARLPDGSRVNAIIPPLAVDGPAMTIRKFAADPFTVEDLIAFGTLNRQVANFLASCVAGKANILVSGGTGSGKTTTLNVLSSFVPETERIVTVEDAAELQLHQEHVIRLESRPPNIEGRGEVSIRDLVRNSLRMRPDRILVGEVRDAAALDMLQAMNTGHDGSLCTVHANAPRDTLARIETMVLMAGVDLPVRAIREQVSSAIDLIVQMSRLKDGTRQITHLTEVVGMEGDIITLQDIFTYDYDAGFDAEGRPQGRLTSTGLRPNFLTKLMHNGVSVDTSVFAFPGGRP